MPSKSVAKVAFASIGFVEGSMAPPDLGARLEEALAPGKSVVRHKRLWRLPQHEHMDDLITGRVGFEYPGAESGIWDEQRKDYRDVSAAHLTRYMIDTRSCRVAFELKSKTITPWTFQGNFQALLNANSGYQWRVELEGIDQLPWEEWRGSVSRITKLRIKLLRPNPRYPGKEVENLIEGAKLSAATLAVKGEDIDPSDSELIEESIQHYHAGYGTLTAEGFDSDDRKIKWRSEEERNVASEPAMRDPDTHEVPPQEMERLLRERASEEPS